MKKILMSFLFVLIGLSPSFSKESGLIVLLSKEPQSQKLNILIAKAGKYWRMLGGGVDKGETFAQAAAREAYEESAGHYKVDVKKLEALEKDGELYHKGKKSYESNKGKFDMYAMYVVLEEYAEKKDLNEKVTKIRTDLKTARKKMAEIKEKHLEIRKDMGLRRSAYKKNEEYMEHKAIEKNLKHFAENKEFLWVSFEDFIQGLKTGNSTFTVHDSDNLEININIQDHDFQRLHENVVLLEKANNKFR